MVLNGQSTALRFVLSCYGHLGGPPPPKKTRTYTTLLVHVGLLLCHGAFLLEQSLTLLSLVVGVQPEHDADILQWILLEDLAFAGIQPKK